MNLELFAEAQLAGQSIFPKERTHLSAKTEALYIGWTKAIVPIVEEYDVLEVESEFSFSLLNPDTEAPSKTFVEAGKIDGVLRNKRTAEIRVLEHKTTSDSLSPEGDYWPRLVMDTQASKYILNARTRGMNVNSVIYDVVCKPAQKPRQIGITDAAGVKIVLDQAGNRVTTKDGKKFRQTGDADLGYVLQTREETPDEYFLRILGELSEYHSEYYVQRHITRSDSDLLEYMNDAWASSQQILYFRRNGIWPRNPSACTQYGTCEMFDLCAGRATVDGIRYAAKPKRHAELVMQSSGGKELLTNSRLLTLRKCARYHQLKYETPTERVGAKSDPLEIGTMFHEAAEAFLKMFVTK